MEPHPRDVTMSGKNTHTQRHTQSTPRPSEPPLTDVRICTGNEVMSRTDKVDGDEKMCCCVNLSYAAAQSGR